MVGFAGRCKHRPLRMQGKVLPNFAGYPRREPAMHPSVCALRRIQLPLQGSLPKRRSPAKPPLQGEVPPQAAEGCGAWPYQYPFGPPLSCVGADDFIGPPAGLMGSRRSSAAARFRPQCRAGDFARRLGFAAWQGLRDDASIVPYGCRAGFWQVLQDISAAGRQCTPQAAPCGASSLRFAVPASRCVR